MGTGPRLYVKITRDTLPRVKDKYPFLYLEHGRLAIDDSSVKWIDSDGNVVRIPIATIEGEENFVGDSEIIALGGASNETKDRPLG